MSNPGYLAHFEEGSFAQIIAEEADQAAGDAVERLLPPELTIPLDHVLEQQERFEGLSADGHRGTPELYTAYLESDLAIRDAQLDYDMFRDAALPAETAAERFGQIDGRVDFYLSDAALEKMTSNLPETASAGPSTSALQAAGVTEDAKVTEASDAVTEARGAVRIAHKGFKSNLLEVKKELFAAKRDAAQEEVDAYEDKIKRVGRALDFLALVYGATSAGGSLATAGSSQAEHAGVVGDVGGAGTAIVKFGADLAMGSTLDAIKAEVAAHAAVVKGIASLQLRLEIEQNEAQYNHALEGYAQARKNLETAVETRRKQYATAGRLADASLAGTEDEGQASRAMLVGSAALEARELLDAAIVEHGAAAASVHAAEEKAEARKGTWWYRDAGSMFGPVIEHATENLGGGPDVVVLGKMARVLDTWQLRAGSAKNYLDDVAGEFEANILRPAGAGGTKDDTDVY